MPLFHTPLFNRRFRDWQFPACPPRTHCEREIDRRVYALLGLTDEEIRLIGGQASA